MKTIEQFVEDAKVNTELQEQLKKATDSKEAMNEAIKAAGYDVTVEDIAAYAQNATADLSDEEVEALAGGDWEDDVASAMGCCFVACGCICWM